MKAVTSMVFAGVLGVTSLVAVSARAQCTTDTECKGTRVCRAGACAEPTQACRADVDCPATLVCSAGVCSASAAPGAAPVQHAAPPPAGPPPLVPRQGDVAHRTETRGIKGLIIAGPIVFGVAYVTGIAVTAGLEADSDLIAYSTIPVAGPWVMMADDRTRHYSAALAANGILQAGGLTMFVIGLSVRREHQVPVYTSDDGSVRVGVSTVPLAGGSLVSASGRF